MMNETTQNFLEVWNNLPPYNPPKVFYRLYYNDDGSFLCYTMEDLPGKYIELDLETYRASPPNVKVVDGKLVIIKPASTVSKLTPSLTGTPCDPADICVIVDESLPHTKWSLKTNDADT